MNRTAMLPATLVSLLVLAGLPAAGCDGPVSADVRPALAGDDAGGPATVQDPAAAAGPAEPDDEGTPPATADAVADGEPDPVVEIVDAPIEPWRLALLADAFRVASAMPERSHPKDRARVQQDVVTVMIELDLPLAVVPYINQIRDWRRGDAFADLAFHRARRGDRRDATGYLGLAERIAETTDGWRRDRIRVNAARTHALIGRDAVAQGLEFDVVPSETGVVDAVRMESLADDRFDAQLESYAEMVATGGFDLTRNILVACVELYDRFYEQPERREQVRAFIEASWTTLPTPIRLERLMELADVALDRGDMDVARPIVDQARAMLETTTMSAEAWVPLSARVIQRRARLGDMDRASSELDAATGRYEAERDLIIGMFRAGVLRPLAEAAATMGDREVAHRLYALAVEEGAENANARPRAMDLSATLASMAAHGVQPDAVLAARLVEIRDGLGDPW